ncbi:hypothetical protein IU501_26965 [Nocardia otitidiscaviarum]|uniref:hypothetical protein n=1 Tax=Nocardia otitidiscaviarum TaxID=1823 RepID=UPI0004A6E07E|nr:hypothetical protein [Nocardia otitidiscaviarum]MBF6136628.1 hypothetical protein [Nocardia otitidiscaviarum]MBF6484830.1 hypothetical protein [Nocardia otitidiscaviarum]
MPVNTDALARRITRCHPQTAAVARTGRRVADELLNLGAMVPADDWLIIGGSLARGEPTFIPHGGDLILGSDIDCTYVHYGDEPSMPVADLVTVAEKTFPHVDMMTMPLADYRALGTLLGFDVKNIGLSVTDRGLPPHDSVQLDMPRDAYENLLYYTQAWFWSRCTQCWLTGPDTAFHHTVSRLCVKILRSTAMLDGAYCHHDLHKMPTNVADRMRSELAWRANPTQPPMNPGRFWTYLADAFDRFDTAYGCVHTDAVTGTRYSRSLHGHIIAGHHQRVHRLARHLAYTWLASPDPHQLANVMRQVWDSVTGWTGTIPHEGPEDYFAAHQREIHDHLLEMKVRT